jgi:tetratricopeptide (TPR) repeat protein
MRLEFFIAITVLYACSFLAQGGLLEESTDLVEPLQVQDPMQSTNQTADNESEEDDIETWMEWALIDAKYGYYNWSIEEYGEVLKRDPSLIEAWNNRGVVFAYNGSYEDALECYGRAIEIDQNNWIPWNNKGYALYRQGRFKDALDSINRSLELDKDRAASWNNMGVVLDGMDRHVQALECYNRSLEADIYYSRAWNNKGVSLAERGYYNDAQSNFYNAMTIDPKNILAYANAWYLLNATGQEEKANKVIEASKDEGFNWTAEGYQLELEAVLMEKPSAKKVGGFYFNISIGAIILVQLLHKRRGSLIPLSRISLQKPN